MNLKFLLPLCALMALHPARAQNAPANAPTNASTEATLYATMPSLAAHRPEMALDGDGGSYFQSAYDMGDGDDFTVLFSRPIPIRSLQISTGNGAGDGLLTHGFVEISGDGASYSRAATFDAQGVASATLTGPNVVALRIRLDAGASLPSLILREIALDSPSPISRARWGAGRSFSDVSQAPDLAVWAKTADTQMDEFWPDAAALLYSSGFITPNKVNVVYRGGESVTPVAATGGGVMTVNVAWCRAHPEDTGLTVHEMAHVVQSMSAYNPVWLIEGIADYVRWVKFEPQNFRVQINPATATYHDSYRTTGAFLAWCELHFDSRLVSKLNRDVRAGTYSNELFKTYCGQDVDALWQQFLAAYRADPKGILAPVVAPADRARTLPTVTQNRDVPVDLTPNFNTLGLTRDGATFDGAGGFDGGGAALSASWLGATLSVENVRFSLGAPGKPNIIAARQQLVLLPRGKFMSLWLLGAAVEGPQRGQKLVVGYTDGTSQMLAQNFSDWFAPQHFPGETRALKMSFRNLSGGTKDARNFEIYRYGFALDATKTVLSLTLPDNPNLKIAALSLGN